MSAIFVGVCLSLFECVCLEHNANFDALRACVCVHHIRVSVGAGITGCMFYAWSATYSYMCISLCTHNNMPAQIYAHMHT
jgi:hypothetical protein